AFRDCRPEDGPVIERWLFDPDLTARGKAEALFRARRTVAGRGEAEHQLLDLSLKAVADPDPARGRVAAARVKEIAGNGLNDLNAPYFIRTLVRMKYGAFKSL